MSVTDSLLSDIRKIIESTLPPFESAEELLGEGGVIHSLRGEVSSQGSSLLPEEKIPSKDGEYIKKHLGVPLCLALAEIVRLRPSDPIHFLGHWLMKWRWNNDEKNRDEDRVNALIAEQKRVEEEMIEKKRRAEARLQKEKDILRDEALLVVNLELDRLLEGLDLPDLPEPPEPEPVVDEAEMRGEHDGEDDYNRERGSERSYDPNSSEDPLRSPRKPRSEDNVDRNRDYDDRDRDRDYDDRDRDYDDRDRNRDYDDRDRDYDRDRDRDYDDRDRDYDDRDRDRDYDDRDRDRYND